MTERYEYRRGQANGRIDSAHRAPGVPETAPYQRIVSEISHLAQFPPGKDPYMGACYAAVTDLLTQEHALGDVVAEVLSQREISPKHFW